MKTKIHKEGFRLLIMALVLLTFTNFIALKKATPNKLLFIFLATLSSTFYCWLLYFFRDPVRKITPNQHHVLAPADGKVVAIKEIYEDEYFKERRLLISIFMSPFNVHVNRSPIDGVITFFRYHAGRYLVAFNPKSSKQNERTTIVLETKDGFSLMLRQVAGFVARRIKFYHDEGDYLAQGAKCGFIKFGSRADLIMDPSVQVNVEVGQQVRGGISVLAQVPPPRETEL